jgi:two-component system CitB family sensor kinase
VDDGTAAQPAPQHPIADSVLVVDPDGVVIAATESALRILRLPASIVGVPVRELVTHRRLADLITGRIAAADDAVVLVHDRLLEVTRARWEREGSGVVVLVRDKTGVIELLSELDGARAFADALTTQQRDHVNRLHLLMGLLQLGNYDDALSYLSDLLELTPGLSPDLAAEVAVDPSLTALLVGKATIAAEHGVALRFSGMTSLEDLDIDNRSLISIIGNLIDNAMDAVTGALDPRVDVDVLSNRDGVELVVADNGPGVPEGVDVFADGFSTKPSRGLIHRGMGLALVRHLVARTGGTVRVHNDGGAIFTVTWPLLQSAETNGW